MSKLGKETDLSEAKRNLYAAVAYAPPDGTEKLCDDCMMHVESGPNKDRCTIHGPYWHTPNEASCIFQLKGKPALPNHILMRLTTPASSGLVYGKILCKRCVRANEHATVCVALTDVLQKVLGFAGEEMRIEPDACCGWQRGLGQQEPHQVVKFPKVDPYDQ